MCTWSQLCFPPTQNPRRLNYFSSNILGDWFNLYADRGNFTSNVKGWLKILSKPRNFGRMPHKKFLQQKKYLKTLRHHLKPIWLQFLQISTKITLALVFLEWSCRNRISNCSGANVQLYTCVLLQNLLHIPFYSGEKIDFQWRPFWTRACLRRCEQNFINWGSKFGFMKTFSI